jgi:hypothetical protein
LASAVDGDREFTNTAKMAKYFFVVNVGRGDRWLDFQTIDFVMIDLTGNF